MSSPFVAEIRIFACNFAPNGWALCNGQLMSISQNTALFSLVGTFYGGDGKTTFGLPNLQGAVPMFWGQGPGLSSYSIGETGGTPTETLLSTEMPSHPHFLQASPDLADNNHPTNDVLATAAGRGNSLYYTGAAPQLVQTATNSVNFVGGSLPHNNMMPYLTLNFCIALQGIFPPRS